jgi:glycosyltransferase involved in cell wall biosynthesis
MKIVHYMAGFRLGEGGVVRGVLDLCGALAARGHDVTLLTLDDRDVPGPWRAGGPDLPRVELIAARRGGLGRLARAGLDRVQRCLDRTDVLHLHVPWDPVCGRLARLSRRLGVPYVVTLHGMLDDYPMARKRLKKQVYLALGGRRMLERAAAVHCTAQGERDQSRKWYPRGRPAVVPLIFDLSPFRELPGPGPAQQAFPAAFTGEPTILFVGRLHPIKRIELLIETVARLRENGRSCRLLVAGRGEASYERSLRALARRRGLDAQVGFLGFVSGSEKISLYEAADVFALPSYHENWGFVLVEALACGTPIVTTRAVNIWSELESGGGATVVAPTAPALAQAVANLLDDEPLRLEMGRRGRAWATETFDPAGVIARYERWYEGVASR